MACRGFNAKGDIGQAAGDICSDGGVGELGLLIASDGRSIHAMLRQELIKQQSGSGVRLAIDEANGRIAKTFEIGNLQRISALNHQAHLSGHQGNDAVRVRVEPFLVRGDRALA